MLEHIYKIILDGEVIYSIDNEENEANKYNKEGWEINSFFYALNTTYTIAIITQLNANSPIPPTLIFDNDTLPKKGYNKGTPCLLSISAPRCDNVPINTLIAVVWLSDILYATNHVKLANNRLCVNVLWLKLVNTLHDLALEFSMALGWSKSGNNAPIDENIEHDIKLKSLFNAHKTVLAVIAARICVLYVITSPLTLIIDKLL